MEMTWWYWSVFCSVIVRAWVFIVFGLLKKMKTLVIATVYGFQNN